MTHYKVSCPVICLAPFINQPQKQAAMVQTIRILYYFSFVHFMTADFENVFIYIFEILSYLNGFN